MADCSAQLMTNSRFTLTLTALLLASVYGFAQPVFVTHWSLEARIAEADTVVRGRITEIKRIEIVPPGGRNAQGILEPEGIYNRDVIVTVDEVLKGKAKGKLDNLRIVEAFHYREDYDNWQRTGAALLVYLGPEPAPGQKRDWNAYRLDPRGNHEPLYSADLTVLKDTKSVLDRAQTYASIAQKKSPTHTFRLPPALANGNLWSSIAVPVDAALEERARKLIALPQEFVASDVKLDDLARRQLRYAGVTSLGYFKSEVNAKILRSIVNEPFENFKVEFQGPYSIQRTAHETLVRWDVEFPRPKWLAEAWSAQLGGALVEDAAMKHLAALKNLQKLDAQSLKATVEGLKELALNQKLNRIDLSESHITDAVMHTLGEIDLLHALTQASTRGDRRPQIAIDVIAFDLDRAAITDPGLRALARLENLATLNARNTQVNGAGFKDLVNLKQLTVVNLDRSPITDAGLKETARLPNLSRLGLAHTKITDDGLKELAAAKRLKVLDLDGTKVSAAGLKHLAGLKELIVLNLTGPQVTDETLRALGEMRMLHTLSPDTTLRHKHPASDAELTTLGLDNTAVTDAGLKELAGLTNLRVLSVGNTKITGAGFKHLAGLSKLTEIFVRAPGFTETGLQEIKALKNLKTLHMHGKDVTDARLRALCKSGMVHVLYDASSRTDFPPATFPPRAKSDDAVRSLDLGGWRSTEGTVITDVVLKDLAGLRNLVKLDLTHTYVTGSGLKDLAGLQQLTTLSLGGPQVRDAGLTDLPSLKNLTGLGLHDTSLTSAGMKHVVALKNLKSLKLTGKTVTDAWLQELTALQKLTYLRLYWTTVTPEGIAEFRKARPDCVIER